jgi:GNAT superfamily N-acetyltransferase
MNVSFGFIGSPSRLRIPGDAMREITVGSPATDERGGEREMDDGRGGGSTAARLAAAGLEVPAGYSIASYDERPDLDDAIDELIAATWPRFMTEDEVANAHFGRAYSDWPQYQFLLVDAGGALAAVGNAMPLDWDGTDAGLPAGWREQVLRSVADLDEGRPVDTLGAMQIAVRADLRRAGLSGTMVQAFRAAARAAGYRAVIACVRPTDKHRYPLAPIESYARWTREDGLPFDPWIRLHARLGGRIVRASPEAMTMRGSVADWESWTGMAFPESGRYVVPAATQPVVIDRERDEGVYHDQNVWMVHNLR